MTEARGRVWAVRGCGRAMLLGQDAERPVLGSAGVTWTLTTTSGHTNSRAIPRAAVCKESEPSSLL